MNQVPEFYMGEWQKQISEHRKLLNFDISTKIFDDKVSFEKKIADRMEIEKSGVYFT